MPGFTNHPLKPLYYCVCVSSFQYHLNIGVAEVDLCAAEPSGWDLHINVHGRACSECVFTCGAFIQLGDLHVYNM